MSLVAVVIPRFSLPSFGVAKLTSFGLLSLALGAGYALYVAGAPDSEGAPSGDQVAIPPLVKAEPLASSPGAAMVIPEMGSRPIAPAAQPSDRTALIKSLQRELAEAGCYNGPTSGTWTARSKEAMRGFIVAVNAQLPVDNPDPTLLALMQSNPDATCEPRSGVVTGALPRSAPPPTDERPMLERAWAPAEMLVPPKETTTSLAVAAAPQSSGSITGPVTKSEAAAAPRPSTSDTTRLDGAQSDIIVGGSGTARTGPDAPTPVAVKSAEATLFDGGERVIKASTGSVANDDPSRDGARPSSASASDAPAAISADASPSQPQKTAQKRAKAKRRPADDVSTSLSKGIQSIQHSISSMFD